MFSSKNLFFTRKTASTAYQISRSLRFRRSAVGNLTRTFGTPTTQNTFSFSCWTKRGLLSTLQIFFGYSNLNSVYFTATDTIALTNGTTTLQSTAVYRDPSAWYHILYTQSGTTANIYVNGILAVTGTCSVSFNTASVAHCIGSYSPASASYDGYIAEVYFVDGQVKAVSDFTATDATTGVIGPKAYTGTYGNNGFYLPFTLNNASTYSGSFNGSSQLLSVADNAVLNMGSGSFTVEAWVNFTGSGRQIVVTKGDTAGTGTTYSFQLERDGSGFLVFYIFSGATSYTATGTTAIPTGQWVHIAGVRNGNSIACYINGIQQATTANVTGVTINSTANPVQISGYGGGAATGWLVNGSISNVRIVKGTAVYTSNFTPSSQPLTAISGTSLLCLQSSSVTQDNSGNSLTITNVGTVTTSTATPFVANITSDASGQNNGWTSNNINYTSSGTTYDSMIDVPTNYSDGTVYGRGNYATLNPLCVSSPGAPTFSQGNLYVALASSTLDGVTPSTIGVTSGKWYLEFTCNTTGTNTSFNGVAISYGTNPILPRTAGIIYSPNGQKRIDNTLTNYGSSWTTNDVIGIAIDADTNQITFYKNNVSQGAISFTPTSTIFYNFYSTNETTGLSGHHNFGQRPFTYTPPSGFSALNTQNLPTPTIAAGNKYFDATTYTGNAGTQSITNSGSMQPDLVWIKDRNTARSHYIANAVIGGGNYLSSDSTNAEGTTAAGITSFNTNGVTLSYGLLVNNTSETYVAWQWNAGGSTVSNTSGSITSQVRANPTAGFSVVTWTGNGSTSSTVTIGHGLGVAPAMIIIKKRSSGTTDYGWSVWHTSLGGNYGIFLNSTAARNPSMWAGYTNINSSVFSPADTLYANESGQTYVTYCFAPVAGYSSAFSYTGNGSADGPMVYLGFRPRWVMIKRTDVANDWVIVDTSRNPYNLTNTALYPNSSSAEVANGFYDDDILSNGFKIRATNAVVNASGGSYIGYAIAENPFKVSRAR